MSWPSCNSPRHSRIAVRRLLPQVIACRNSTLMRWITTGVSVSLSHPCRRKLSRWSWSVMVRCSPDPYRRSCCSKCHWSSFSTNRQERLYRSAELTRLRSAKMPHYLEKKNGLVFCSLFQVVIFKKWDRAIWDGERRGRDAIGDGGRIV